MTAAGPLNSVGEYRGSKWGGVEDADRIEALRQTRRSVRHCLSTGPGSLPPQLNVDLGLDGVDAKTLPAMLDFGIGKCEAVLKSSGHLGRGTMSHRAMLKTGSGRCSTFET